MNHVAVFSSFEHRAGSTGVFRIALAELTRFFKNVPFKLLLLSLSHTEQREANKNIGRDGDGFGGLEEKRRVEVDSATKVIWE